MTGWVKTWNGLCPAGKHGLDFKGQPCDLCPPAAPSSPPPVETPRGEPPRTAVERYMESIHATACDGFSYEEVASRRHLAVVEVDALRSDLATLRAALRSAIDECDRIAGSRTNCDAAHIARLLRAAVRDEGRGAPAAEGPCPHTNWTGTRGLPCPECARAPAAEGPRCDPAWLDGAAHYQRCPACGVFAEEHPAIRVPAAAPEGER